METGPVLPRSGDTGSDLFFCSRSTHRLLRKQQSPVNAGPWTYAFDLLNAVFHPTSSAGTQGSDLFAAKVISLQKSVDRHRYTVPPVGINQINRIVRFDAVHIPRQFRFTVLVPFFGRFCRSHHIGLRIRFQRFNVEQLSSRLPLNLSGLLFRVAAPGKRGD